MSSLIRLGSVLMQAIRLFLPVLFPAWNFFDRIGPSPRIQYTCLSKEDAQPQWQEFRPLAQYVSPLVMLARLFFNKRRNESLFLVSCAERLAENTGNRHAELEIARRIQRDYRKGQLPMPSPDVAYVQFRIVFVQRSSSGLEYHVGFLSRPWPLSGDIEC